MPKKSHFHPSDLQGLARMVTDATIGITDLVETMHRRVTHPPLLPSTPIQHMITGIAGITFRSVKFTTQLISGGLDKTFGLLPPIPGFGASTPEREAAVAALNGVVGDYLVETDNPLAIPMQFRYQGQRLSFDSEEIKAAIPKVNGKILLMVHGVCMTDAQWNRKDHDHGEKLATELGLTPLYLFYNGGLPISKNGEELNAILEELVNNWPEPVEEINILAHSMGGLVSRSALQLGEKENNHWPTQLKKIVFLGTPHHGAPLERAGNYVDIILEATPYAKPFARLGKIRSKGITDLRHGDATPLPDKVACYAVAATSSEESENAQASLPGDGLVPVASALGRHKDPRKQLGFAEANTWIAFESNHLDLLSRQDVYAKIKTWISG